MGSERFQCLGILSQTILRFLSCSSSMQVKLAGIYKRRKQKNCAPTRMLLIPLKFWLVNYACQLQDEDE